MTKAQVFMDNCGFETTIMASLTNDEKIKIIITSKCHSIQKLSEEINEIDPFEIIGQPIVDCPIHKIASKHIRHPACIVPSAIARTIEVESGMALPGDSTISIKKD